MRTGTVSYKLEDLRKGVIIPIGMVGENDFTRVIFDAEEVFKKHPDAQVTMKVQPPKGGIYPATVTRDGNAVIWQVKAADVAHRGSGELQLTFNADTMVEKSYIARTDIKRSLVGNGPAPDPVQDWVDNAEEVLEDLEAAEVHQPIIGLDGYWYTWNQGTGEYEKTNTKAQGQDGHSPVLTSSKSGKTTTIFADGDQLAQILDGEDGQGADVIDDTAGEGDTDKTWSANKLDTEITDVKTAIDGMKPIAQQSDIGKALILKTIDQTGKPTAFEYGEAGSIDPQDIADAVDEWLDEHPEATTTVEDGSITEAKLDSDLQGVVNGITVEVKSKNLINPNNLVTGRLQSDGTVNSMSSYKTSDYILLEAGKTYKFTRESLTTAGAVLLMDYSGYGLYNTSKEWIANSRVFDSWPNNTILSITPENDCYIRVTGKSDLFTSDASGLYILQQTTALDGYESWFAPYTVVSAVVKSDIVQSSGSNLNKVMSQKAVTEHVSGSVSDGLDQISEYVIGKNKYNPSDCTPQDQKMYNTTTGVQTDATAYAITGKIPVEANTAYVFSSTSKAIQYLRVFYYSGESGGTSISNEEINSGVGFTTPADCTFVAFNLFGGSHTTEEYNAAIAAAQLEKGAVPTQYEEYERKRKVLPKDIEGGDQLTAIEDITEVKSLINLYDKTLAVDGKYYNTGVPYSDAGWAISGKIPVKPNTQYCVSRDPTTALQFPGTIYSYGSDGAYLGTLNIGHYVYNYLTVFTTSANVYYISFNMKLASHTTQDFNDTIDTIMLCYGTQRPLTYSAYNAEKVLIEDKLSNAYFNNANCFKGKKWLALGTSITWYDSQKYQSGVHTDEVCHGYVGNIARRKPLIAINEGISGATLADVSENSLINRYTSIDWDVDIATIEFGVNDYGYDIDVGTAADAAGNTTFASCLKTVIEYALAQNPKLCLVICTEPDVRGTNQNNNGNTLKDYTDVTLEIATQYRLPVCDWYYKSGINAINEGSASVDYMTADGTHPNDAGHMRMGAMLNQVFDSLLC